MERLILQRLLKWKHSPYRKPLILKGVRQVGKTWILKEFGRRYYENVAYFNFDEQEEYQQFFETTKNVDRILQNLMLASGQTIHPEKAGPIPVTRYKSNVKTASVPSKNRFSERIRKPPARAQAPISQTTVPVNARTASRPSSVTA